MTSTHFARMKTSTQRSRSICSSRVQIHAIVAYACFEKREGECERARLDTRA